MSLRIKPKSGHARARLTDEFIEAVEEARTKNIIRLREEIRNRKQLIESVQLEYQKQIHRKELARCLQLYKAMTQEGGGDVRSGAKRGGLEYDLMRLRKQPFVLFDVRRREKRAAKQTWLIGKTHDVISDVNHARYSGTYDQGKYFICVNAHTFGQTSPQVHVIPEQDWRTVNRHMHHIVTLAEADNPLDWVVNTCWGSFGGIMANLWLDGDIPEIFNHLYMFVKRLHPGSPLATFDRLPHIRRV